MSEKKPVKEGDEIWITIRLKATVTAVHGETFQADAWFPDGTKWDFCGMQGPALDDHWKWPTGV